ncbi:MAG: YhcH/YjgK/YiaL family protein [Clostridia bacterium]|nr:YhcH/YjgK/YiaL family protein [Clostridia bacterium]MBQ7038553.1 YhcH/YjgK/YiaL family protein [Clostridia bacterium]MBQ9860719.1 YhcH/YjgK/YiaL family protein [Clostridia bacterium]
MASTLPQRIVSAVKLISSLNFDELKCGRYDVDDEFFYLVQEYETKMPHECKFEAHKKYVDIQYIVKGKECMEVTASAFLECEVPYDSQKDIVFFKEPKMAKRMVVPAGKYEIFFPKDAHKPGIAKEMPEKVLKIVGKVKI